MLNAKGATAKVTPHIHAATKDGHTAEESTTIPGPLTMLSRALRWLAQGVELVPIQDRTKHFVSGFGPNREHITDEESARYWWGERSCNLGVVCGSGLVCLDFDDSAMFESWLRRGGRALAKDTLIEQTTRGYHVWFFTDAPIASGPDELCEIKARGAVIMSAPSIAPSGWVYSVANDTLPLRVDANQFFSLLSNPQTIESLSAGRVRSAVPSVVQIIKGGATVDCVKREFAIYDMARDVLRAQGFELQSSDDVGRYFIGRCPFHDDSNPSFFIDAELGFWRCRVASCAGARGGDVINLYGLAHGLSNVEALRELARELR